MRKKKRLKNILLLTKITLGTIPCLLGGLLGGFVLVYFHITKDLTYIGVLQAFGFVIGMWVGVIGLTILIEYIYSLRMKGGI